MKSAPLALAVALVAASATQAAASGAPELYGVWRNPKNTVHLEIRPCGESACGYVVWASPKAQADAKRGSGRELVGQQLFRNFEPENGSWRGKVYVPDHNLTVPGTVRALDAQHLEAKGCLLGRFGCKRQVWSRVDQAAS